MIRSLRTLPAASANRRSESQRILMPEDDKPREPLTLKRWSARKLAAAQEAKVAPPSEAPAVAVQPTAEPATGPTSEAPTLPPVDSLTFDSDFTAFMRPDVDPSLKRLALKKLLHDPRFNVMDGLDTYIDDYSKPDPIDPDVVRQLMQARYIFNPPQTRVTEAGFVEDVPPEAETQPATPETVAGEPDRMAIGPVEPIDNAVEQKPDATPAALSESNK
jgi:hypothetical protein